MLLGRQYLQGQDCLKVILLSRSRLEKGHILNIRFTGVMSPGSRLIRGDIFKIRIFGGLVLKVNEDC